MKKYRQALEQSNPVDINYDAFISYCHKYPDIKVAHKLFKLLERFRLPKRLIEESASQGRWKVFMDNYELPVTSDLLKAIEKALKASRFLVLLCSTKSHASPWVEKEVHTFALEHGWDHILPILIEGTPETSFPPPLLEYRNIRYLDVSGEPSRMRITAAIKRRRAWFCHRIAGCDHIALKRALRARDVSRAVLSIVAAAAFMLSFSLYALNLRAIAQESTLEAQRLNAQTRISLQNAQAQRLVYEEALAASERAVQEAEANALWVRVAEAERELAQGQLFPAKALAEAIMLEPGAMEEIAQAAQAIIERVETAQAVSEHAEAALAVTERTDAEQSVTERAQPIGRLTEIFSYEANWTGVCFTPDSKTLLIVSDDGVVHSYPTDTYMRRAVFQSFVIVDRRIRVSDSGRLAALFTYYYPDLTGTPNFFMLDPQTLEQVHLGNLTYNHNERNQPGYLFDFLPGTETIYAAAALEQAYKIEGDALIAIPELPVYERYQGLYALSDKLFLLFNGWYGNDWPQIPAALFNLETGEETALDEKTMLGSSRIDCSPDGRFLAYRTDIYETPLYVFDRGSGEILLHLDESGCKDVAFSQDGSLIAVSRYENDVEIYETEGFTLVRTYELPDSLDRDIAFVGGNGMLAFLEEVERSVLSIKLLNADKGEIIGEYDPGEGQFAEDLLASPDGTQLVTRTDGEIKVWLVGGV